MRIGFNLLPFNNDLAGTTVYALNIIRELLKKNSKFRFILFVNKKSKLLFHFKGVDYDIVELPFQPERKLIRIFWEQILFPVYLKKYHIDLLFSPSVAMPLFAKCKNVVCIHDLIPFFIKKKYSCLRSIYVKKITKASAKKADVVFTVSRNSQKEIIKKLNIASDKIKVTYNSINGFILKYDHRAWKIFRENHKIIGKYLLFVGTIEPGKNLINLIKGFKLLIDGDNVQHKLVIAGKKGWLFKEIFQEVKKLGLESRVVFTGYVPNEVIGLLYMNADVFILPSLYEGFGIPALEAMALGTPVIVSNVSSLPEIVGNAGVLIDPSRSEEIANAIAKIIFDSDLKDELNRKGLVQAKKFSWERSSQVIFNVFEEMSKVD